MEEIIQYSSVLIKPGVYHAVSAGPITLDVATRGAVVEIYGNQELFSVDIGSSPKDWDNIDVRREDIIKTIRD